jgi:hypothetical protein
MSIPSALTVVVLVDAMADQKPMNVIGVVLLLLLFTIVLPVRQLPRLYTRRGREKTSIALIKHAMFTDHTAM